jgi:4'-phosphopantetheinyl transferase
LDGRDGELERLHGLLSMEEQTRARSFRTRSLRDRYVVGRGVVRTVLGRCLDTDPGALRLGTEGRGKPVLSPGHGSPLQFNLAHAGPLGILAVAPRSPVGVDVEERRPVPRMDELVARFPSPVERALMSALTPEERRESFLLWWTRKEAVLKATGEGIGGDLASFDVSVTPGAPPAVLGWRANREDGGAAWSLFHLEPEPGYVGALALRTASVGLQWMGWV